MQAIVAGLQSDHDRIQQELLEKEFALLLHAESQLEAQGALDQAISGLLRGPNRRKGSEHEESAVELARRVIDEAMQREKQQRGDRIVHPQSVVAQSSGQVSAVKLLPEAEPSTRADARARNGLFTVLLKRWVDTGGASVSVC